MNNDMDLLKKLDYDLEDMSKSNKQIATYILENYDKAAYMTAAKLADIVGVSESTVVRFACIEGFDGYPEFQDCLQELLKSKLTWVQRLYLAHPELPEITIKNAMKSDLKSLSKLNEEMNIDEINKVCDAILAARRVYVIGVRSSLPLAQFLHYYLNHILENVTLASPAYGDIFGSLMYADERDLIIGISFPRYSKTTMEGMHFAKKNGAKTIAITDTEDSPLVSCADTTVFVKSNMNSFVDSLVAPMSILNSIIVMVGISRKEKLTRYFDRIEDIWAEKDIYTGKNPGGKTDDK